MILFKGKKFKDYVDFFVFCCKEDIPIKDTWFPHTYIFNVRRAIQDKFGLVLSIREVQQLINQELALKTITMFIEEKEVSQSNVSC